MRLYLILLLMLAADPAFARHRVTTPQGAQLELRNEPPDALPPIPLPDNWLQSLRYQIETQGEFYWLGFLLDHGSGPLVWPRDQHIWLMFADSSMVQDTVIMVSEPMQTIPMLMRKTFIGKGAQIPADQLWRKPLFKRDAPRRKEQQMKLPRIVVVGLVAGSLIPQSPALRKLSRSARLKSTA